MQTVGVAITGDELAKRRSALALTQKELADKLRLSLSTVQNYERDGVNPRTEPLVERVLAELEAKPTPAPTLQSFSDSELLAELALRLGRASAELNKEKSETDPDPKEVEKSSSPKPRRKKPGRLRKSPAPPVEDRERR